MKERFELQMKKIEEKILYYMDFGDEGHGKPSFRLWVNQNLVKTEKGWTPYIEFPLENAKIERTEMGNFILRPVSGWNVFWVSVKSGYRGNAYFEVISPPKNEVDIFEYKYFHSSRGKLGISIGGLINVQPEKLIIRWKRSGKLHGDASHGITIYKLNGTDETIEDISDWELIKAILEEGG